MAGLMTAADVARRWSCTPDHVARLARHRKLRAMRLGSDWRFSLADVEAYEAAHTSGPELTPAAATPPMVRAGQAALARTIGGLPDDYEPVYPHLVGRESVTKAAASSVAGRSRSARTKKPAPVRG